MERVVVHGTLLCQPLFTIGLVDPFVSLRMPLDLHGLPVPFNLFLQLQGHDPCQANLGQVPAMFKIGKGPAVAFTGINPLMHVPPGPGNGLWHRLCRIMIALSNIFLLTIHLEITLRVPET